MDELNRFMIDELDRFMTELENHGILTGWIEFMHGDNEEKTDDTD